MPGTQIPLLQGTASIAEALGFVVVSILVMAFLKKERRHVFRLVVLYGLSWLLSGGGDLLLDLGLRAAAQAILFLSRLLTGIAFLNLFAVVVFAVALRAIRIEAPRILRDLTVAFSYIALVLYLFSRYHVDIGGIVATSAVITAVIGFSLQDTLSNVMGGVAIQLDNSIEPGDFVRVGEDLGRVREIGWRKTLLETRNGDRVLVPNAVLMKNPVLIQGSPRGGPAVERRWVYFQVPARVLPERVLDAVTAALQREPIPNVEREPAPHVLLMDFHESLCRYAVRYWLTDLVQDEATDSVIRVRVAYALRRAGIRPASPETTVFLNHETTGVGEPDKDLERRLGVLSSVAIFGPLTEGERRRLAPSLIYAPFAPGEAVVVQGKAVHNLYVLARGEAEVRVVVEGAPPRTVARLSAPDFFGEMGMLTGEPRKATVIALDDVECWRLEKEKFQEILKARPAIADEISHVLATRDVELAAVKEGLSEEAKRLRVAKARGTLVSRIKDFFEIT